MVTGMRKSLATAASVLGVALAGAAAFAANSSVLSAETSSQEIVSAAPATFPAGGVAPQTSVVSNQAQVAGSSASQSAMAAPAAPTLTPNQQSTAQSTQPSKKREGSPINPIGPLAQVATVNPAPSEAKIATYKVGTSGSVIVESDGQTLRIVNTIPASGWTARTAEASAQLIRVYFTSPAQTLEFRATLVGGQIEVKVQDETVRATPIPAAPREHHDDDDDDDEHEEHEEREHHDDDDD